MAELEHSETPYSGKQTPFQCGIVVRPASWDDGFIDIVCDAHWVKKISHIGTCTLSSRKFLTTSEKISGYSTIV